MGVCAGAKAILEAGWFLGFTVKGLVFRDKLSGLGILVLNQPERGEIGHRPAPRHPPKWILQETSVLSSWKSSQIMISSLGSHVGFLACSRSIAWPCFFE